MMCPWRQKYRFFRMRARTMVIMKMRSLQKGKRRNGDLPLHGMKTNGARTSGGDERAKKSVTRHKVIMKMKSLQKGKRRNGDLPLHGMKTNGARTSRGDERAKKSGTRHKVIMKMKSLQKGKRRNGGLPLHDMKTNGARTSGGDERAMKSGTRHKEKVRHKAVKMGVGALDLAARTNAEKEKVETEEHATMEIRDGKNGSKGQKRKKKDGDCMELAGKDGVEKTEIDEESKDVHAKDGEKVETKEDEIEVDVGKLRIECKGGEKGLRGEVKEGRKLEAINVVDKIGIATREEKEVDVEKVRIESKRERKRLKREERERRKPEAEKIAAEEESEVDEEKLRMESKRERKRLKREERERRRPEDEEIAAEEESEVDAEKLRMESKRERKRLKREERKRRNPEAEKIATEEESEVDAEKLRMENKRERKRLKREERERRNPEAEKIAAEEKSEVDAEKLRMESKRERKRLKREERERRKPEAEKIAVKEESEVDAEKLRMESKRKRKRLKREERERRKPEAEKVVEKMEDHADIDIGGTDTGEPKPKKRKRKAEKNTSCAKEGMVEEVNEKMEEENEGEEIGQGEKDEVCVVAMENDEAEKVEERRKERARSEADLIKAVEPEMTMRGEVKKGKDERGRTNEKCVEVVDQEERMQQQAPCEDGPSYKTPFTITTTSSLKYFQEEAGEVLGCGGGEIEEPSPSGEGGREAKQRERQNRVDGDSKTEVGSEATREDEGSESLKHQPELETETALHTAGVRLSGSEVELDNEIGKGVKKERNEKEKQDAGLDLDGHGDEGVESGQPRKGKETESLSLAGKGVGRLRRETNEGGDIANPQRPTNGGEDRVPKFACPHLGFSDDDDPPPVSSQDPSTEDPSTEDASTSKEVEVPTKSESRASKRARTAAENRLKERAVWRSVKDRREIPDQGGESYRSNDMPLPWRADGTGRGPSNCADSSKAKAPVAVRVSHLSYNKGNGNVVDLSKMFPSQRLLEPAKSGRTRDMYKFITEEKPGVYAVIDRDVFAPVEKVLEDCAKKWVNQCKESLLRASASSDNVPLADIVNGIILM